MLKTNKRRIFSFAAMLIIVFSLFASFAVTASAASWQTGRFDSGYTAKGYTTVRLSNTKKAGYIKIFTYDVLGKKTSAQIHVTLRDNKGKWIVNLTPNQALNSNSEMTILYTEFMLPKRNLVQQQRIG